MLFLVSKTCKVSAGIPQDQRGNRARFKRSACKVLAAPSRQMCKIRTADRQGLDGRRARFGRSTFGKCARFGAAGAKKPGRRVKTQRPILFHQTGRVPEEVFHRGAGSPIAPFRRSKPSKKTPRASLERPTPARTARAGDPRCPARAPRLPAPRASGPRWDRWT